MDKKYLSFCRKRKVTVTIPLPFSPLLGGRKEGNNNLIRVGWEDTDGLSLYLEWNQGKMELVHRWSQPMVKTKVSPSDIISLCDQETDVLEDDVTNYSLFMQFGNANEIADFRAWSYEFGAKGVSNQALITEKDLEEIKNWKAWMASVKKEEIRSNDKPYEERFPLILSPQGGDNIKGPKGSLLSPVGESKDKGTKVSYLGEGKLKLVIHGKMAKVYFCPLSIPFPVGKGIDKADKPKDKPKGIVLFEMNHFGLHPDIIDASHTLGITKLIQIGIDHVRVTY